MYDHIIDGFELGPGESARSTRAKSGDWTVWIERGGLPLSFEQGKPLRFCGATLELAKRAAAKWMREKHASLIYWKTDKEWIVKS